jgi:cytoskeletal protein CcmA (bactofilin family)
MQALRLTTLLAAKLLEYSDDRGIGDDNMSIFAKRRDEDEEIPRPGEAPSRMTAHTGQPHTTVAAPSAPRAMPVPAQGSTNIGRTVTVKGDIRSEEDLLIDGQMEGRLDLGGNRLVVGPNGKVRASIVAREVDVQGAVNGNVEAAERIILRKNSKLVGDLKMASVVIEDGAYFKGSIDIKRPQDATSTAPAVIANPPALPNAS